MAEERKNNLTGQMKMMDEGKILESYGQKYLITVSPAAAIGKVRWSIVELGTKGANHNDFYMELWQMRQLVEEIDSGKANAKFAADKDKSYPEAYKYVTGEDGCKRLAIGGGNKGIRISISIRNGEKWDTKLSVAPYPEIVEMCFLYKLTMGLIITQSQSYYDNLYWMFKAKERDRNKAFKTSKEDAAPALTNEVTEAPKKEEPATEPVAEGSFKIIGEEPKEEAKPEVKVEAPTTDNPALQEFRMRVTTPLTPMAGEKAALKGVTEDNKTLAVVFGTNLTKNVAIWKTFETKGSKAGSIIRIKGVLMKDRVIADSILA